MELVQNNLKVFNAFRLMGQASKADVARQVSLSHPAVTQIVARLCHEGLLKQEKEKRRGVRGQPATLYSVSSQCAFIGLHIGPAQIRVVALALTGDILASTRVPVGFRDVETLANAGQPELDRFISSSALDGRRLLGIGIATPLFRDDGHLAFETDMRPDLTWNIETISKLFEWPAGMRVFVENDGSCAALAELIFGSGAQFKDFLYVNIASLISGGLVIDGNLRTGAHGNSAALGPFLVTPSTLTTVRSQSNLRLEPLLTRASVDAMRAHAERHDIDIDALDWNTPGALDSHAFLNAWIADCAAALAQLFVGVWSLVDTEAIVLDGALPVHVLERIVERAKAELRHLPLQGIIPSDLRLGTFRAEAKSVGAACLPILGTVGPPVRAQRAPVSDAPAHNAS